MCVYIYICYHCKLQLYCTIIIIIIIIIIICLGTQSNWIIY